MTRREISAGLCDCKRSSRTYHRLIHVIARGRTLRFILWLGSPGQRDPPGRGFFDAAEASSRFVVAERTQIGWPRERSAEAQRTFDLLFFGPPLLL
jgi:hypothetical protein